MSLRGGPTQLVQVVIVQVAPMAVLVVAVQGALIGLGMSWTVAASVRLEPL